MISIPDWGIPSIRAKIDTGAKSSAIDVVNIQKIEENRISFEVIYKRKTGPKSREVQADVSRHTRVRSSNGQVQDRYLVQVPVKIGPITKTIEFSLVCRKHMICRVILGRKALEGDFIVDSGKKFLFGRSGLKPKKKTKSTQGAIK